MGSVRRFRGPAKIGRFTDLVDDPAGTSIQVAHLAVAHKTVGKTHRQTMSTDRGVLRKGARMKKEKITLDLTVNSMGSEKDGKAMTGHEEHGGLECL